MAVRIVLERTGEQYRAEYENIDNEAAGQLLGFLQLQIGLWLWKKGMDADTVKSVLLDVYFAACEDFDTQRIRILKERREYPGKPEKRGRKPRKLNTGEIMRLHREGWSSRDIAESMDTLEGQIDYIIRKENECDEEDDVCVRQVR